MVKAAQQFVATRAPFSRTVLVRSRGALKSSKNLIKGILAFLGFNCERKLGEPAEGMQVSFSGDMLYIACSPSFVAFYDGNCFVCRWFVG